MYYADTSASTEHTAVYIVLNTCVRANRADHETNNA